MSSSSPSRTRLGAAAGLLGVVAALTAVAGAGPVPSIFQLTGVTEDVRGSCDELEHAGDPACVGTLTARGSDDGSTSSTVDDRSTSTTPTTDGQGPVGAGADVRTVRAGDGGSVLVAVDGASLRLLTANPTQGWMVSVERAVGREVEVTFRSGSRRVDLDLELEDAHLRQRVRTRDDGTDVRAEDGTVASDDDRGSGSDDVNDDVNDDNGGSGHGSDDVKDDTSGRGSDDGPNHG